MLRNIVLFVVSVTSVLAHHEVPVECKAIALLNGNVHGNVTFVQGQDGLVHVTGVVSGLPAGQYGFHVHEKGDITGGCASTGSHYNPAHNQHGHPEDQNRHAGDLGNIECASEGVCYIEKIDNVIQLSGPYSIVGRGLVLHERADDYGRTSHPDSKTTGNAGGRIACGVIGILDPVDGCFRSASSSLLATLSLVITALLVNFQI